MADTPGAPVETRPAPGVFSGRMVRKVLWKQLHLPRVVVHGGLTGTKTALAWRQVRQRRALAMALPRPVLEIPEATGVLRFEAGKLPGTAEALSLCQRIVEDSQRATSSFNPNKQDFLRTVIAGDDFARWPELIRFMISRPVVEAAAHYLGSAPVLAGAALWWTPPNQSAVSSQLWHLDNEDARQLKVFVNLTAVDGDQGPFTCIPADRSREPARRLRGGRGRLDDQEVLGTGGGEPIRLTGPAGSGAFVDTARCLHFGSRGNRRERVVLMFQFLRLEAPTESTFRIRRFPALQSGLDELQHLAISA